MTPSRLREIKRNWIGDDGRGLAVKGNESYRQVGELIRAVEEADTNETTYTIQPLYVYLVLSGLLIVGIAVGALGHWLLS